MKKNFLMVAALLIAAMLMVVSCTQEVAPKNELVKATIGLAYGKDVTVDYGTAATGITYKYELEPLWSNLENGAPIYGATIGEVDVYSAPKKIGDNLESFKSNYVTPGYWQITVNGYVDNTGIAILTGSTKAYFNNGNDTATVYVSPVETEKKGNLTINLEMEDLDADDAANNTKSKIYFYLDTPASIDSAKKYLTKGDVVAEGKAAHKYSATNVEVTSGYHTITIKVDGYEGGITKSFLMIPGNDVTIEGSVYPSRFKETESTITVVSLGKHALTVAGTKINEANHNTPVPVTSNNVDVSIAAFDKPISDDDLAKLGYNDTDTKLGLTYSWYLDGEQNGRDTNVAHTTITLPVKSVTDSTLVPGDYTVTCIAKYTYKDASGTIYTVYGCEEYAGKIRVEASNKVAPAESTSNE